MIYYFSGTGNSHYIASELAKQLGDYVLDMSTESFLPILSKNKQPYIGFVFPVYAWGIPKYVRFFLTTFLDKYYNDIYCNSKKQDYKPNPYIYVVLTCGDDVGKTAKEFAKIFHKRNLRISAFWSIKMPNTYVAFPGFDVDSATVQKEKIRKSKKRIVQISNMVKHKIVGIYDVYEGVIPRIKSFIIKPLFEAFLSSPQYFHVVNNQCVSCGKCVKVCHLNNISVNEINNHLIPKWGKNCTQCFSCYHHCPQHAIRWGIFTNKKNQYLFRTACNLVTIQR